MATLTIIIPGHGAFVDDEQGLEIITPFGVFIMQTVVAGGASLKGGVFRSNQFGGQ